MEVHIYFNAVHCLHGVLSGLFMEYVYHDEQYAIVYANHPGHRTQRGEIINGDRITSTAQRLMQ